MMPRTNIKIILGLTVEFAGLLLCGIAPSNHYNAFAIPGLIAILLGAILVLWGFLGKKRGIQ
ncbi:MAG TPA: hypothetical protein VGN88_09535 [Phycisphaerae bacterium]|jgi:hypothetical protein